MWPSSIPYEERVTNEDSYKINGKKVNIEIQTRMNLEVDWIDRLKIHSYTDKIDDKYVF